MVLFARRQLKLVFIWIFSVLTAHFPTKANAALAEVQWYRGFHGDPRVVGRGGSGTVLSDNFWGVLDNPAGSALVTPGTAFQVSRNTVEDRMRPVGDRTISLGSGGFVVPETPWGFSTGISRFGYHVPVSEFTGSVSRLFYNERLSLGVALHLGRTDHDFSDDTALGGALGVIYRFPKRILIGASFRSQMSYRIPNSADLVHPWVLALGVGQIPNRVFKYEVGIRISSTLLQPHLGLEYKFVDLRQLKMSVFTGAYHDGSRPHGTIGFGIDPWVFFIAASLDVARQYNNYLFSFGIDVGRILKKTRLIPSGVSAVPEGILPNPVGLREDWLPQRLQDDPDNAFHEIGTSVRKIRDRVMNFSEVLKNQDESLEKEKEAFEMDWNEIKEELD